MLIYYPYFTLLFLCRFILPSLLYAVNNNIYFAGLMLVPPPIWLILTSFRTVVTASLYKVSNVYSSSQWTLPLLRTTVRAESGYVCNLWYLNLSSSLPKIVFYTNVRVTSKFLLNYIIDACTVLSVNFSEYWTHFTHAQFCASTSVTNRLISSMFSSAHQLQWIKDSFHACAVLRINFIE